jgi:hypothetical protein
MNCWGIRRYFTKVRFSLNGGYIVYMELLSGHEKIITKSGISLNARTLNRGFTVCQELYILSNNDAKNCEERNASMVLVGKSKRKTVWKT